MVHSSLTKQSFNLVHLPCTKTRKFTGSSWLSSLKN
ncbi:hypothetical protein LINPERHAP2_LOCUS8876 [Linum perenne]